MTVRACPTPTKRAYDDKAGALGHARWLRRGGASVDVLPYRCPCGSWHVGHSQVSLRRRIRRAIATRRLP